MSSESPEILGRYAVYAPLAAGGMATVHLGRLVGPVGFSRTVAIKRMRADLIADPEFVSMFVDEARVAGRVSHPNVVAVNDVVATDRELLLVMEYVPGETLARLMQLAEKRGGIPAEVGAAIVRDALAGLHAAHETRDEHGASLGIVHRDVSPQNIMVGVDGVARVLDFGVAKAIGRSQVTREGELKGKLAYMAPEQLQGSATRASDVFAASIILWEILSHKRLFRGETDAETVGRVLTLPVEKPSQVHPELGEAFDAVALRGLARKPEERYETARDMALDLTKAGTIADAARVGEWVAEIARDRLADRAKLVSEVERGVVSVGGLESSQLSRPSASLPSLALSMAPASRSSRSRIALATTDPFDTRVDAATISRPHYYPPARSRWTRITTAVAIAALSGLVIVLLVRAPRVEVRAAAAAPPPPAVVAIQTPAAPAAAQTEPAPLTSAAPAPSASATPSARPARAPFTRPVAPPPAPSPAPKAHAPAIPDHL